METCLCSFLVAISTYCSGGGNGTGGGTAERGDGKASNYRPFRRIYHAIQGRIQGINEGRNCWQKLLINIHLFMKFIKIDGYLARAS